MTLDPVFRSRRAILELQRGGYLDNLKASLDQQREAVEYVNHVLPEIIGEQYVDQAAGEPELEFLQRNLFLALFHSILSVIGCDPAHLRFYSRLNYCIKGIVTAGDNLFDGESKRLLPLKLVSPGARFESIIQLLSFDRLTLRVCDDAIQEGWLARSLAAEIRRDVLSCLTVIGELEGSEEEGVGVVLPVDEMIERVHRVRGGALFSLGFIAPRRIESGTVGALTVRADEAIKKLGTAFQIVDDITDLEFDVRHSRHNLVVSYAYQEGDEAAQKAIDGLIGTPGRPAGGLEGALGKAAAQALGRAQREARRAFEDLAEIGFWLPPSRSDVFVRSIVGIEGTERIEDLPADDRPPARREEADRVV